MGEYIGRNIAYKKVRVAGIQSRTHVHSRDLVIKFTGERKSAAREYEFIKTKSDGGRKMKMKSETDGGGRMRIKSEVEVAFYI